ncbi:MAG: DUF748 domain-containing protein [Phycisphaeraceae bacterium]|nr:DUF748 domain-containing protein [Phycisphaeraceae bacterium]
MSTSTVINSPGEPGPEARAKRAWWRRRWLKVILALVLLYTLFGFFGVPYLVRSVLIPRFSRSINGTITLEKARYNPFLLSMRLDKLEVRDSSGDRIAGFARFDGDFQLVWSIWNRGWVFREAVLTEPFIHAVLTPDGELNWQHVMKASPTPTEPTKAIPRIVIGKIALDNASILFRDETLSPPLDLALQNLAFAIDGFDSQPKHENVHTMGAVSPDGATVKWGGVSYFDPLTTSGRLTISDFHVAALSPYLERPTRAGISSGVARATIEYDLAPALRSPRATVNISDVMVTDLHVELDGHQVLRAPKVVFDAISADLAGQVLEVKDIIVTGADVRLSKSESGVMDVAKILRARTEAPGAVQTPTGTQAPSPPAEYPIEKILAGFNQVLQGAAGSWAVNATKLQVQESSLRFEDRSVNPVVLIELHGANLEAGPIASKDNWVVPLQATAGIAPAGTGSASGTLGIGDTSVDLAVEGKGLDLAAIAQYLPTTWPEPLVSMHLKSGTAGASGRFTSSRDRSGVRVAGWSGVLQVDTLVASGSEAESGVTLDRARLDGTASAAATGDELHSLSWEVDVQITSLTTNAPLLGPVSFEGLHVELPGREPASIGALHPLLITTATVSTAGRLRAEWAEGGALRASWDGGAEVAAFHAESGASSASLQGLKTRGILRLDLGPGSALEDLVWNGTASLQKLTCKEPARDAIKIAGLEPLIVREATISADGSLDLKVNSELHTEADWTGRVAVDKFIGSGASGDETFGVEHAVLDAGVRLRVDEDFLKTVEATGKAEARGARMVAPIAGSVEASVDEAHVDGEFSIAFSGSAIDTSSRGTAAAKGVGFEARDQGGLAARVESAEMSGFAFSSREKSVSAESLVIEGPSFERTLQLAAAPGQNAGSPSGQSSPPPASNEPSAPSQALVTASPSLPFRVRIGSVALRNGSLVVHDAENGGRAALEADQIAATAAPFDTNGQASTEVTMSARIQQAGTAGAKGTVNLFASPPNGSITFTLDAVPLPPFDAFASRYVGYRIDTGRMSVDMPLTLDAGTVGGTLAVNFDRLHLGDKVASPDAPDVPVKLGLDLLRDSNDRIEASIPVSGNVNDPQFSITGLIWKAFFNLLLKAATSPFQLIGSIFGGNGDQDLSMVVFEPGSAELTREAKSKIDVLAKALKERPAISLTVVGRMAPEQDTAALRPVLLREQAAAAIGFGEDTATLSESEYHRGIDQLFRDQFQLPALRRNAPVPQPRSLEEKELALLDRISVPLERLADLAAHRAAAVAAGLIRDNAIGEGRVTASSSESPADAPIAEFKLE